MQLVLKWNQFLFHTSRWKQLRRRWAYVWEGEEWITGNDPLNIHNLPSYDRAHGAETN